VVLIKSGFLAVSFTLGASLGASMGTLFAPSVGTIVGAVVGAAVGFLVSAVLVSIDHIRKKAGNPSVLQELNLYLLISL
jgi:uncharacterized membrane protein YgaE (UPF0421/DUF939 family)